MAWVRPRMARTGTNDSGAGAADRWPDLFAWACKRTDHFRPLSGGGTRSRTRLWHGPFVIAARHPPVVRIRAPSEAGCKGFGEPWVGEDESLALKAAAGDVPAVESDLWIRPEKEGRGDLHHP